MFCIDYIQNVVLAPEFWSVFYWGDKRISNDDQGNLMLMFYIRSHHYERENDVKGQYEVKVDHPESTNIDYMSNLDCERASR